MHQSRGVLLGTSLGVCQAKMAHVTLTSISVSSFQPPAPSPPEDEALVAAAGALPPCVAVTRQWLGLFLA